VSGHVEQIDLRRFDEAIEDLCAVAEFKNVALRRPQQLAEGFFVMIGKEALRNL
jgi:hypothetical protein